MNGANPRSRWQFFQAFLKSPRVVASMVPSSHFLERHVVEAARLESAAAVVELGAGTGGTTRALLDALGDDARLLVIERTAAFIPGLRSIDDPRLEIIHGCASDIRAETGKRGVPRVDAVVSGIPFSSLPPELARRVVSEIHACLSPGGRFVAYQVTDRVAEYARPVFGAPRVEHEILNLPPLRIFTWTRY